MAEDFAVLDFALVAAAPRAVAVALAAAEAGAPQAPPRTGGVLGRLFGRKPAPSPEAPLLVQPAGTLPRGVLAREMLDDMGFGGADREIRLSAPVGNAGYTLIEWRERTDGGPSPRLVALSRALPAEEILAFRLTGGQHPGGEYGFAVYRGGQVVRRLGIHRADAGSDWEPTQSGTAHALEAEAPLDPSDPGALMTPARQAGILAALGIDADRLLVDRDGHETVLELSTRPGGTAPEALAEAPPEPEEDTADAALAWEDEVTGLLVTAVTDALPEDEQVPWLDAMTADLEAGRTEAALDRARALLDKGSRPAPVRAAAAARLAVLFGH
ncbi:hypothetical protein [Vannielia litorea]|uniref:Uncharacterized protein n=1 Tax=Vannielia litorea TaxID=1217970 RepID=A0A1N6FDL3_9RHOB|nr:hypothetical protein [Vannielia litorea]SIN93339.1 hypothetical protein SAMN05444002_1587 [Vannielia litorea]